MVARADLVESFLAIWSGPAPDDLAERLDALVAAAEVEHPGLGLSPACFIEYVAGHARADELASVRAGELYLCAAVLAGVPGAAARFIAWNTPIVRAALARLLPSSADRAEVAQTVWKKLVVGDPGRPRLGDYTGQRPLGAWLHVIAARAAIDHQRRASAAPDQVGSDEVDLEVLADGADDPELALARRRDAGAVKRAFAAAVARLDPGDRTLLRQHVLDRLTIDELGVLLGVHRVTAARRLDRARRALTTELRRHLAEALGLSAASVDSLLRFVESRVELSVERVLASDAAPPPDPVEPT